MAEYVGGEPMAVGIGDPITFVNKTDDSFSVDVGVVFRKSGLYRVTVDGKYTSVEIEPKRKKGKWLICDVDGLKTMCKCSKCGAMIDIDEKYRNFFCYHCGDEKEVE